MTDDYDIFLLWESIYYTKELLESHFNDPDKGWAFFSNNSAYISSDNPSIKARGVNRGNYDEEFERWLTNDDKYWLVICPVNNASGTYKFTAAPANSNYLKSTKTNSSSKIYTEKNALSNFSFVYPNPFKDYTIIDYSLLTPSHVQIKIYNMNGNEIQTLDNAFKEAGKHRIEWIPNNNSSILIPPGLYIIKILSNEFIETIKVFYTKN